MAEWVAILGYLVIQFLIGYWVSLKIKSQDDYLLAGRSLGLGLATFSIFATWFGAETCMGSAGMVFEEGLAGGRADPFGYSICLLAMGLFLATRLWKRGLTTLADLYKQRFSGGVERLAVWIIVPSSMIWAAAQIRAFGQIISTVSPVDVSWAVSIAAAIVIAYTYFGGLLGDVITDVVQGGILIIGLGVIAVVAFMKMDGFTGIVSAVQPEQLRLWNTGESFWVRMDTWMIPILGSVIAQELISRVLACRSSKIARRASLSAASIYLVIGAIPVGLGLLGVHLGVQVTEADQFLPAVAKSLLPSTLYIIFIGALTSAILSTVDSTLLAVSALVSNNLFHTSVYKDEKKKVRVARLVVIAAGVGAYIMALYADRIYDLVELASSFGGAGVFTITIMALFTRIGGWRAASATLVFGVLCTPFAEYILEFEAPFITSVIGSFICYLGVSFLFKERVALEESVEFIQERSAA